MHFNKLEIKDKLIIDRIIKNNKIYSSDYSLSGIFLWVDFADACIAVESDMVFIKGLLKDELVFLSPLCAISDYDKAIKLIKKYACDNDIPLKIILVTDDQLFICEQNNLYTTQDLSMSEYIYNRDDLVYLKGKKYHAKRNHINKFIEKYGDDYSIREYTGADFNEVMQLIFNWAEHKGYEHIIEQERLEFILNNKDNLDVNIALLVIKDKIYGISIYEIQSDDVAIVLYEKCDLCVRECNTIINNSVAKLINTELINRQEDTGHSGLRQVKRSYNPVFMLHKYIAIDNRQEELRSLYEQAFSDSLEYTDYLFNNIYNPINAVYECYLNKVVSALHIRYKNLRIIDEIINFPYIMGVATDKAMRNRGYCAKTINRALIKLNAIESAYTMLYPFNHNFYAQFGFVNFNYVDKYRAEYNYKNHIYNYRVADINDVELIHNIYNQYTNIYDIAQHMSLQERKNKLNELFIDNGKMYIITKKIKHKLDDIGYVAICGGKIEELIVLNDNSIHIQDIMDCIKPCDGLEYKVYGRGMPYAMIRAVNSLAALKLILNRAKKSKILIDGCHIIEVTDNILGKKTYKIVIENNDYDIFLTSLTPCLKITDSELSFSLAGEYRGDIYFLRGEYSSFFIDKY